MGNLTARQFMTSAPQCCTTQDTITAAALGHIPFQDVEVRAADSFAKVT